jgi:hypothetical protein
MVDTAVAIRLRTGHVRRPMEAARPGFRSALGLATALSAAARRLESVDEGVKAGGEPFVAVVDPHVGP